MHWAPVVLASSDGSEPTGSLAVVGNTVEWRKIGTVFRRYSMQSPVHAAVLARYPHCANPEEYWVVIVCTDRLVHSYATTSGNYHIAGITFAPSTVLPCASNGVLLASARLADPAQRLHLLQGPEELPGAVVPSSVCGPLARSDELLFFGSHYAVVWCADRRTVRAYSVRFIHRGSPRPAPHPPAGPPPSHAKHARWGCMAIGAGTVGSGFMGVTTTGVPAGSGYTPAGSGHRLAGQGCTPGSGCGPASAHAAASADPDSAGAASGRLASDPLSRVAVFHLVKEWRQAAVGRVFEQELELRAGRGPHLVAVHDPVDNALFVLNNGDLLHHSDVSHAAPLRGPHGYPLAALASGPSLRFVLLMFPYTKPLRAPLPKHYRASPIAGLESDPHTACVKLLYESEQPYYLCLATRFSPLVHSALGLVLELYGPAEAAFWIVSLLANVRRSPDPWSAFARTMDVLARGIDPAQLSQLVLCLHLLREEYSLAAGSGEDVKRLGQVIKRYISTWGPEWKDYYASAPTFPRSKRQQMLQKQRLRNQRPQKQRLHKRQIPRKSQSRTKKQRTGPTQQSRRPQKPQNSQSQKAQPQEARPPNSQLQKSQPQNSERQKSQAQKLPKSQPQKPQPQNPQPQKPQKQPKSQNSKKPQNQLDQNQLDQRRRHPVPTIPEVMAYPPNIYDALSEAMEGSGDADYPQIVQTSPSFPKSKELLIFFHLLSTEISFDAMTQFLMAHFAGPRLNELSPFITICVLEVAGYLDIHLGTQRQRAEMAAPMYRIFEPNLKQRLLKTKLPKGESVAGIMAQALFPSDRRFDEAERLLQIKRPQQCAFGAFFDPETIEDHDLAHLQVEWGRALGERTLASAFGRAALNLETRTPLYWEQLEVPVTEFSGECTYTGLTIPPFYKSLEQVSLQAPWGVFAHGVALGLSVRANSPGIDSLWVITSACLKIASTELYAGMVLGMGLSGYLARLEEWQFYESLVSSNFRGTVAALLGVAASKRGSKDSKLTKVLSVHVRALLPEPARSEPLVGPEEERAAIIAMGLLYLGQGARHLTEVLSRELLKLGSLNSGTGGSTGSGAHPASAPDDTEPEAGGPDSQQAQLNLDDDYCMALGLALGLINAGKSSLEPLLPLVTRARDRTSVPPGVSNGALCALMLSFAGSNQRPIAAQLRLPSSQREATYSLPSMAFSKALAHHLIMWDSIGNTYEWVVGQLPAELKAAAESSGEDAEINSLWSLHSLAGIIIAVALRHIGSNDGKVISMVLAFIKQFFYPRYSSLLKSLTRETADGGEPLLSYSHVQAATNVAQLISALCLAVAATAAGSGNVQVLQVLRVAHQINPQVQASERPDGALVEGVGIDPIAISEAIGWLFMGGGQWSFKEDPQSVALLAAVSFMPLLGGPGINSQSWYHIKFLWALVTERRCLFIATDPTGHADVEIEYACGDVRQATLPLLLPPLSSIKEARIVDPRYRAFVLSDFPTLLRTGVRVVRTKPPKDSLEANFSQQDEKAAEKKAGTDWEDASAAVAVRTSLELIQLAAERPDIPANSAALRLLLLFMDSWSASESPRILTTRFCEQLKLSIWRATNGASDGAAT